MRPAPLSRYVYPTIARPMPFSGKFYKSLKIQDFSVKRPILDEPKRYKNLNAILRVFRAWFDVFSAQTSENTGVFDEVQFF